MIMIQRPQRIDAEFSRRFSLLPVNPPEIHAVLFIGLMQYGKIRVRKLRVENIKLNLLAGSGVRAHGFRHFRIHIFKPSHAVRRVQIQRDFQPFRLYQPQKFFIIGKQFLVPGISRPAVRPAVKLRVFSAFRNFFLFVQMHGIMPVHIHRSHAERNFPLLEAV